VSLKDSLDGCERILRDEFKDYPESALYMIGAIGEAKKPNASQPEAKKPEGKQPEAAPAESKTPDGNKGGDEKSEPQPKVSTPSNHES